MALSAHRTSSSLPTIEIPGYRYRPPARTPSRFHWISDATVGGTHTAYLSLRLLGEATGTWPSRLWIPWRIRAAMLILASPFYALPWSMWASYAGRGILDAFKKREHLQAEYVRAEKKWREGRREEGGSKLDRAGQTEVPRDGTVQESMRAACQMGEGRRRREAARFAEERLDGIAVGGRRHGAELVSRVGGSSVQKKAGAKWFDGLTVCTAG